VDSLVRKDRKAIKARKVFRDRKANKAHKANKALRVKREWLVIKVFKVPKEKKGIREIPVQPAQPVQRVQRVRKVQQDLWGHLVLLELLIHQASLNQLHVTQLIQRAKFRLERCYLVVAQVMESQEITSQLLPGHRLLP
jgi:hypothetical protein